MPLIISAADIGSNTAHLLVAEVTDQGLRRLTNVSDWLSLGEVVSRTGEIGDRERERLVARMAAFKKISDEHNSDLTYVFATEAMRRARNHDKVLQEIKRKTGLDVEIVSPKRETELSLRAVAMDCPGSDPFLLVEMGGGSMQIAHCNASKVLEGRSTPLGTGALIAHAALEQPPTAGQFEMLNHVIRDSLSGISSIGQPTRVVAAGGVARGIWRALHPDLDRRIAVEELDFLAWDTRRLSTSQISSRYGVKLKRAQTLLPGSLAFAAMLRAFGKSEMVVSEFGVREGAILELASTAA